MNRITLVILLMALMILSGSLMAAETSVHGRLYAHWGYNLTDVGSADGMNDFGLSRAYVTVKSKLSDNTSARITTDLRPTEIIKADDTTTRYDVIFKYGYIDWMPAFGNKVLKLRFGLQPTAYIAFQNDLWSRRYIAKNIGDLNKILTSSDAGLSAIVALGEKGKYGSVQFGIFNGTSYTDLNELNKQKDLHLFANLNPLIDNDDFSKSAIGAQYYKGTRNMEIDDTESASDFKNDIVSFGALIAYADLFNFGADLNWQTEGQGAGLDDEKESGMSVFGTLFLGELTGDLEAFKTLNLFGRYDTVDPDTNNDNDAEKLMIVGIECNPTKGFKASINIRVNSFDDDSPTKKQLFVNTLFKF